LFTSIEDTFTFDRAAATKGNITTFYVPALLHRSQHSTFVKSSTERFAPSSSSMSNAQQQGGQSRQPVSYPSPTSYPSPSLSSAQYNYPPPNNQVSEPYRSSPTGSNGSLSLPSMRSLDPQHNMGSPLPPPVAQMAGGPYYHNQGQTLPHPSHQYPNVTSDPTGNMRYALPQGTPGSDRVMSGGRHKKVRIVIPTNLVFFFLLTFNRAGNQAQNQDRLFDLQKEKN
jgi:hypothetical protein